MRIEFDTNNAAFEDRGVEEFRFIAEGIINQLEGGKHEGKIWDSNGNKIGDWSDE